MTRSLSTWEYALAAAAILAAVLAAVELIVLKLDNAGRVYIELDAVVALILNLVAALLLVLAYHASVAPSAPAVLP